MRHIHKPERKYSEIITTKLQLKRLAKRMRSLEEFAFDTETNTLRVHGPNSEFKIVGISISWGAYNNYYIPIGHVFDDDNIPLYYVQKYLKPIFEKEDIRIIGWNLKYDLHVLARIGIFVTTKDVFDGMVASWLCDENTPNGLKDNTQEVFGIDQTHFKEATETVTAEEKKMMGFKANSKVDFSLVRINIGAPYALDDSFFTWELYLYYLGKLEEEEMSKIYFKVYPAFLLTLFKMEERGVDVDVDRLQEMQVLMEADLNEIEYEVLDLAGIEFNPASNQQLQELLFGFDGSKNFKFDKKKQQEVPFYKNPNYHILDNSFHFSPIGKTDAGAPSASGDVLETLAKKTYKDKRKQEGVQMCAKLVEFKKLQKLKTAFVDGILETLYDDGKVHASFNIIGTTSGRISCSSPNLQQLPKDLDEDNSGFFEKVKQYKLRAVFIGSVDEDTGERKKIIAADFNNLEMRILAHFSLDHLLLGMFERNEDSHGSTAVNMFKLDCKPDECKKKYPILRQVGKVLNFLLVYGGGASALYELLKGYGVDLSDKTYLQQYKVKTGMDVAQIYIDTYFDTYKGVSTFIKNQKKFAHRNGFVYTLRSRKRRLPNINGSNFGQSAYEERLAVNASIQGSAGDITISAQNRIDSDPWFVEHGCYMLIQIHDELVFECPEEYVEEAKEKIVWYMSHPFGDNVELNLPFPVGIDAADNYQEAK